MRVQELPALQGSTSGPLTEIGVWDVLARSGHGNLEPGMSPVSNATIQRNGPSWRRITSTKQAQTPESRRAFLQRPRAGKFCVPDRMTRTHPLSSVTIRWRGRFGIRSGQRRTLAGTSSRCRENINRSWSRVNPVRSTMGVDKEHPVPIEPVAVAPTFSSSPAPMSAKRKRELCDRVTPLRGHHAISSSPCGLVKGSAD
jgi:hypothetical protein